MKRWERIPEEVRREVIRLAAQNLSRDQILDRVDVSAGTVGNVLRPLGKADGRGRKQGKARWEPPPGRLSQDERLEIRFGLEAGRSLREIAAMLDRDPSTVSREVARNGGRGAYRPFAAHDRAREQSRRPKQVKLAANPALRARVEADLCQLWSPQQICKRLRAEFGDDPGMHLSHETIYQSLYVQGRGELRRELARCLRTGRASRKRHGRMHRRGKIPDKVMISERPAEADDRAVPGHWEGDLIMGKANNSAIGTLVERTTRYVLLLHLAEGRNAEQVRDAMTETIQTLPEALRRSITWDQGNEMAEHVQFTVDTGVQVYFCDPKAPWQRGSNENTNGLLRQYFPKGTDLSVHGPADLRAAADSLNGRPRQTLDWMTPSEKLAELLGVALTG